MNSLPAVAPPPVPVPGPGPVPVRFRFRRPVARGGRVTDWLLLRLLLLLAAAAAAAAARQEGERHARVDDPLRKEAEHALPRSYRRPRCDPPGSSRMEE